MEILFVVLQLKQEAIQNVEKLKQEAIQNI
jgi:hypothetical protein